MLEWNHKRTRLPESSQLDERTKRTRMLCCLDLLTSGSEQKLKLHYAVNLAPGIMMFWATISAASSECLKPNLHVLCKWIVSIRRQGRTGATYARHHYCL